MSKKKHRQLPKTVKYICFAYEGIIVGGSANAIINDLGGDIADYDIIIPVSVWPSILLWVPHNGLDFKLNSFGGFKINDNGTEIDLWPEDLHHYIASNNAGQFLYRPLGGYYFELKRL